VTVQNFARWFGILYLVVGVVGFVPGITVMHTPPPEVHLATSYGDELRLFPVNVFHDFVHLAVGVWGLAAAATFGGARAFARGLAVFYGVLSVAGLVPGSNVLFGLTPLFGWDVFLHVASAALAAYIGWGLRQGATPRAA